jgi:transposase
LVGEARIASGRSEKTSMAITDAQSVKNTGFAREKGYDAGKKVSGIKRHIAVDTNGFLHAVEVTTANVTDRDGAILMTKRHQNTRANIETMLVDGGYTGEKFAQQIKRITGATVEVVKRNELHTFKVLPKRWVVERTFSWFEKCRRLWKNCEQKLSTSRQMIILCFVSLLLRRL